MIIMSNLKTKNKNNEQNGEENQSEFDAEVKDF